MKRILSSLLLVILMIIAVFFIFVFYLGKKTQESYEEQVRLIDKNSIFEVVSHEYHKNFFTAEDKAVIKVRKNYLEAIKIEQLPEDLRLLLESDITLFSKIKHGPFTNGRFQRASAQIDVSIPPKQAETLKKLFQSDHPFHVQNNIDFYGSGQLQFNVDSFNYKEFSGIEMNWDGLKGKFSYLNDYNQYQLMIDSPGLELKLADKGYFMYQKLDYESTNQKQNQSIDLGTNRLALQKLVMQLNLENGLKFKTSDLMSLLVNVQMGSIINPLIVLKEFNIQADNVTFLYEAKLNDHFIDLLAHFQIKELLLDNEKYGPLNIEGSSEHLNAVALNYLIELYKDIPLEDFLSDHWKDKFLDAIRNNGSELFTNNPVLTLKDFSFKLPYGDLQIKAYINFKDFLKSDLNSFDKMIHKIEGSIDFKLPQQFIASVILSQLNQFIGSVNSTEDSGMEELKNTFKLLVESQINMFAEKGYIKIENNQVSGNIKLSKGIQLFNGKQIEFSAPEDDIDEIYTEGDTTEKQESEE